MGAESKIEWTDHTFNPWWGCAKVSPGCEHCYAETWAKRTGHEIWGKASPRRFFGDKHWNEPLQWDKAVTDIWEKHGCSKPGCGYPDGRPCIGCGLVTTRPRIFCASMADWLEDRDDLTPHLARLLALIHVTPHLDWLLLTKRPENWRKRIDDVIKHRGFRAPEMDMVIGWFAGTPPHNVWIGTTVEDQQRANERIPKLLEIPARVRFLSCEPLLGEVDIDDYLDPIDGGYVRSFIDWVICGGESGPKARPMSVGWARSLRDQCTAPGVGVPFFFKQWGEWLPGEEHYQGPEWQFQDGRIVDSHLFPPDVTSGENPGWQYDPLTCVVHQRVGKKNAGRLLDGREWNEFPHPSADGAKRLVHVRAAITAAVGRLDEKGLDEGMVNAASSQGPHRIVEGSRRASHLTSVGTAHGDKKGFDQRETIGTGNGLDW